MMGHKPEGGATVHLAKDESETYCGKKIEGLKVKKNEKSFKGDRRQCVECRSALDG